MRHANRTFRALHTSAVLAAVALASVLTWAATRGPDTAGYTATDETVYSFVDISGASGGASILADTDDGTATLALPFPFQFYGAARTLLCVSSNGAAYFVPDVAACSGIVDFANTDLSSTSPPGDLPGLFPFWSDLTFDVAGAGAVFYQTVGAPGNRKFIVQWNNAYPSDSSSPVTFQLELGESSKQALFQYKTVDLGSGDPASKGGQATIGIRDTGAVLSGRYLQWSTGVPVIENASAILFSPQHRMTGSGYNAPATANVRGLLTVDVGIGVPMGGSLQFRYAPSNPLSRNAINLASTSLTNVSVIGGTMTINGLGTVNGAAGFSFTATVVDGTPDRFGIVIRRVPSGAVYYTAPLQPVVAGAGFSVQ